MFFNTNTKPVWEWATKTLATGCNSGTSDSSCSKRKITLSFFSLPKLSSRRLKTVKSDQVKPDGTSATDFLEDPLDWEAIYGVNKKVLESTIPEPGCSIMNSTLVQASQHVRYCGGNRPLCSWDTPSSLVSCQQSMQAARVSDCEAGQMFHQHNPKNCVKLCFLFQ